jgi:hypothetical protein
MATARLRDREADPRGASRAQADRGLQLRLRAQQVRAKPVRLPVYRGKGGLVPGLSGLNNKAMLDAADHDA